MPSVEATLTIPDGPEAITPAWLTQSLRAGGDGAGCDVASLQIERVGHGMAGRIARVRASYAGGSGPATLIAKFPAPDGPTRRLANTLRLYDREHGFYVDLARRVPVAVPHPYVAASEAPRFVLLLEDVTGAREGDLLRGCTLDEASVLVEELARLHAAFWDAPDLDALDWLPRPDDDTVTSLAETCGAYAWHRFYAKFGAHMPPAISRLGAWLARDGSVLDRLSAAPRTLVHGDMRANNVLFAEGEASPQVRAIIDWQTAVRGRGPMDVAHFFVSSLQPDDRRIAERELLPQYHAMLEAHGVCGYALAECREDYRLAVANQFSQVVVLSSLLDVEERLDDGVGQVTGGRLVTALLDLAVADLAPRLSPIRRIVGRAAAALRR